MYFVGKASGQQGQINLQSPGVGKGDVTLAIWSLVMNVHGRRHGKRCGILPTSLSASDTRVECRLAAGSRIATEMSAAPLCCRL